jgi:hypothetical protein
MRRSKIFHANRSLGVFSDPLSPFRHPVSTRHFSPTLFKRLNRVGERWRVETGRSVTAKSHFLSTLVVGLGRNSPKLLNVAAWQLLNQLGSKILLQFPFVMGRRKAGFDCPDIQHSPISVWQLPESLLEENLLHK